MSRSALCHGTGYYPSVYLAGGLGFCVECEQDVPTTEGGLLAAHAEDVEFEDA